MSICSVPTPSGIAPGSLGLCSKYHISLASVISSHSPVRAMWPVSGQRHSLELIWALDSDIEVILSSLKNDKDVSGHLRNPIMRACPNMRLTQGKQRQDMETNFDDTVWPSGSSHAWSHSHSWTVVFVSQSLPFVGKPVVRFSIPCRWKGPHRYTEGVRKRLTTSNPTWLGLEPLLCLWKD